jgi:hypothetical protein
MRKTPISDFNLIRRKKMKYVYRFDPVPGIHSFKGFAKRYFRRPKTTQERKLTTDSLHKLFVRGKRSFRNLPEAWDDIPFARKEKGWKRTKKEKQWL